MRNILLAVGLMCLSACGGGSGSGGRVSGNIATACMNGGRAAANPALCSCVQQAANIALSGADQRRAAEFFDDPQKAQDTRQADGAASEAFWGRYKEFSGLAEQMCS
jgi:hypothetical protein